MRAKELSRVRFRKTGRKVRLAVYDRIDPGTPLGFLQRVFDADESKLIDATRKCFRELDSTKRFGLIAVPVNS